MQSVLDKASERFPQFQEHSRFLSAKEGGISRFGGLVRNFVLSNSKQNQASQRLFVNITDDSELSREEFSALLKTIDLGLRGLPATAQVFISAYDTSTYFPNHIVLHLAQQRGNEG
jgi:hypothetical protein